MRIVDAYQFVAFINCWSPVATQPFYLGSRVADLMSRFRTLRKSSILIRIFVRYDIFVHDVQLSCNTSSNPCVKQETYKKQTIHFVVNIGTVSLKKMKGESEPEHKQSTPSITPSFVTYHFTERAGPCLNAGPINRRIYGPVKRPNWTLMRRKESASRRR